MVIVAGSDGVPPSLPSEAALKHPLIGYKGVDLKLHGQPLIQVVMERLRSCASFGRIWVAGPRCVYEGVVDGSAIIDTDATVAENLRCAIVHLRRHEASGPVAFTTCDILPDPGELAAALGDYLAQPACAAWYPLIRVPQDRQQLKAFAWKPEYSVVPEPGAAALRVLPGHLLIADLGALRLPLIYRLLSVAYRTRNRSIKVRRRSMVREVIWQLVFQDLRHLVTLRPPVLTWTVMRNGLALARELRAGTMLIGDLERAVTSIVLKYRYRRRSPARGVRLPLLDALSLAEDADTEEEAREWESADQAHAP
jgi:hypothetical protein